MIAKNQILLFTGLLIIGIISRLVPHVPNVTSVAAISLFAGAIISSRIWAFAIPIVMMFASDLIINNTVSRVFFTKSEGFIVWDSYMLWVYMGILGTVLLGSKFLKKRNTTKLLIGSISATLLFWVLSNFGSFISMGLYPKNGSGLMTCYAAAVPFLRNSLMGDLLFTFVLFGVYDYFLATKGKVSIA